MKKCNDCWMKEIKDTKDRPMSCASCELNYHWSKLIEALADLLLIKIPKRITEGITKVINKISKYI